jgi:predicted ATPase
VDGALKGWSVPEVWDSLHPALELANALRRPDALLRILWALAGYVLCRGRAAETLRWVTELMNAAEVYGDPDLLVVGHLGAVCAYFCLGDLMKTCEHADRVLALYGEERHGHLVEVLNHDPKTVSSEWPAQSTWMLGYPEQALRISDAAHDHARRRGHPFNLGHALTNGALVFDFLREPDEWLKRIDEADRVGRENSLPFITECLVPLYSGIALIRRGRTAEGVALLKRGFAVWEGGGNRVWSPYFKSALAEGMAQLGDLEAALDLVDEAIAQVDRPGWEERWYQAETLRIKGWLLSLKGDWAAAEHAYIASLDWARTQQAKSWELRTATSHARLMCDQGHAREARDLLAPVYGWFTEGFDTADLKEAKALLEELIA